MTLFNRRVPRGVFKKIRENLWPSMGWLRTSRYYRHRLFRTGDSAYRITAGLATGVAVSFSPFLGTHILQSFFISWLLRASLLAGMVGTLAGNPWTFPFMFLLEYKTGIWICGLLGLEGFLSPPDPAAMEGFWPFLAYLFSHPFQLLLPMTVGGYACAVLCWPAAYLMLYHPVRATHRIYLLRRRRREEDKARL